MSNKQTHTVNIVFDGNFDEFVSFLESSGIQTKFSPAGLAGSQHTLEIDDEKVEKDIRSSKATAEELKGLPEEGGERRIPPSPPRFFEKLYMAEEDLNLIKDNSNDR